MSARPVVNVYSIEDASVVGVCPMPEVCLSPIRPDHIRTVHTGLSKNARQAYAVKSFAGYGSSAESWGTGRAVARIPRVAGGGTHRAGQGAFGNMCRGGGMFAPTKTWRRWHRKINLTEKRHAVASAIAACSVPALVMARGHRIDAVPEIPLVVGDEIEYTVKTKQAQALLKTLGCGEDVDKVVKSHHLRPGRGKARNRKYLNRLGPMIVHNTDIENLRGFTNVLGVEMCHVDRLNLLRLAPGASLGRLLIFSESAFRRLNELYNGEAKKGYILPRPIMSNTDLARIINSTEIQSILRPKKPQAPRSTGKVNPLKNLKAQAKINPALKLKQAQ
eukprot:Protomagalhaensia_wolfi_Nauph_80__1611@NODE_1999_length_1249_cov_1507_533884_g1565_i0_p1_GENE_NODE_1999_length_1249_cov_1507_533884_g1565_i0NODE_1999_length_1249_cov_1507_533884_g1565_i0_p1_ORF_typecomplete_len360_score81_63Ribosomal_L4/PF00573_22/1_9e33Ribos_L4_asso_C/PF14374_6/5e21_NODE_1999_length_1249_cov_1507_533884_g1565_i01701168